MKWMTLERAFLMLTMLSLLACKPDDKKPKGAGDDMTDDVSDDVDDDGTIDGVIDDGAPDDDEPDGDDIDGDDVIDGDDPVDGDTDEDEDGIDRIGVEEMLPTGLSADLERLFRSVCAKEIDCGHTRPGETVDSCLTGYAQFFCGPGYATVELPGLDDCLATFTCENANGPVAAVCGPLNDAMTRAAGYTVGQAGEGCSLDDDTGSQQCAFGTYCDGNAAQCGSCVANKENGAACDDDEQCTSEFCDPDDGKCHDRRADGADCEFDYVCASSACVDSKCGPESSARACESDFDCDIVGERCVANLCKPNKVPGAACSSDDQCDIGCTNDKCLWPIPCYARELGESCEYAEQCKDPLSCDANQCITRVALGEACTVSEVCAAGSYCADAMPFDEVPGQCAALKANTSACEDDGECTSGYCDDDGKCAAVNLCNTMERQLAPHVRSPRKLGHPLRGSLRGLAARHEQSALRPH